MRIVSATIALVVVSISVIAGQPVVGARWKKEFEIKGDGIVQTAAFSSDGKLLAWGDSGGTIRIWDFTVGKQRPGDCTAATQKHPVVSLFSDGPALWHRAN